ASAGWDDHIKLWDLRAHRELATLKGATGDCVGLSPDGTLVALGGEGHTIKFWDSRTYREIGALHGKSDVSKVAFSPDGKDLAVGTYDGVVDLWALARSGRMVRGRLLASLRAPSRVCSLVFSPDDRTVAAGYDD